ncbi:DUF6096 family protein [Levilactobacillus acidifarinae]|nr:DUF6096 family protein [Levilactobacillus acidifarinae]GEO70542.1 hypothetical protein LAC03_24520 [Levilactobacillus acidifarinae]
MAKVASMGTPFQFGSLNLSLKLDGKALVNIEKRLGKSAMSLFMNADGGMKLPPVNEIMIVLKGANQKHGVKDSEMVKAFQEYLDDGNSPMDLFLALSDLFNDAGFFNSKGTSKAKKVEAEEITLDAEPMDQDENSL